MKRGAVKKRTFEVHIPSLNGEGVAEVVPLEVEIIRDSDTGEEVLTPESLELIEKTKARLIGLLLPDEIKALREGLNLTQEGLSGLLQLGAKTLTRWETGRARPSRSMNMLLLALRDGRIDIEYLRARRQISKAKGAEETVDAGELSHLELHENTGNDPQLPG
ncbi:MAG TPA: helix-turn-helix domain-containing protein [Candidatus Binatia bacterium]|jgi:DNA-binding transcriptional regulator YiaG|nr:helix-turn-helix domain-containing protein [Candidatus Binatia bacterium]